MELVRELFYICTSGGIEWTAVYLSSMDNDLAHALSSGDIVKLRTLAPEMDHDMTTPCAINTRLQNTRLRDGP